MDKRAAQAMAKSRKWPAKGSMLRQSTPGTRCFPCDRCHQVQFRNKSTKCCEDEAELEEGASVLRTLRTYLCNPERASSMKYEGKGNRKKKTGVHPTCNVTSQPPIKMGVPRVYPAQHTKHDSTVVSPPDITVIEVTVGDEWATNQRGFREGVPSLQCVFHRSSTEDRDRVGSHDRQGWQIGSPVVTGSRNRCIG